MPIPRSVSEILESVNRQPDFDSRVEELNRRSAEYRTVWLDLFNAAFVPASKLGVPYGDFDYRPSDFPGTHMRLYGEVINRFYLFQPDSTYDPQLRFRQFIQTLESIHPDDAKVLVAISNQKLEDLYPNVTRDVVDRVFPELGLVF